MRMTGWEGEQERDMKRRGVNRYRLEVLGSEAALAQGPFNRHVYIYYQYVRFDVNTSVV